MAGSRRKDKAYRWEQFSVVIINAVGWHVERCSNRQRHSWSDKVTDNEMTGADERALGSREVCDPGDGSHCVCESKIQVRVMWWRSWIVIDDTVGEIQRGSSLSSLILFSYTFSFHSLTWACIHVCACASAHTLSRISSSWNWWTSGVIQNWIENDF